jgi:hypothetical protein
LVVIDFMEADSGRTVVLGGIKQPAMTLPPRKRGRPTKVEQNAKQAADIEAQANAYWPTSHGNFRKQQ